MIVPRAEPRTRLGLIIPSSNRMTEPQMRHYAPPDVTIHVTRLRMTGAQHQPLDALRPAIVEATLALADARCDVVVFHCTASAMEGGLDGNDLVIDTMRQGLDQASGVRVTTTASAAVAALQALGVKSVLLQSPYVQTTHDHEVAFLIQAGFRVEGSYCLGLPGSDQYIAVTPNDWFDWAVSRIADHPSAEAVFLSCTNTQTPDVIEALEAAIQRPVITSNQAVLWYALRLCDRYDDIPALGRLFRLNPGQGSFDHAQKKSVA